MHLLEITVQNNNGLHISGCWFRSLTYHHEYIKNLSFPSPLPCLPMLAPLPLQAEAAAQSFFACSRCRCCCSCLDLLVEVVHTQTHHKIRFVAPVCAAPLFPASVGRIRCCSSCPAISLCKATTNTRKERQTVSRKFELPQFV